MRIAPLDRSQLADAELVLADACAFDRATEVAEEKLFAPGPASVPPPPAVSRADQPAADFSLAPSGPTVLAPATPFGAWDGSRLVGVASVCARWLRVIAVVPPARRKGAGSALLVACEDAARAAGEPRLRTLDQPGNYLAPGIDERNTYLIEWLSRRGYNPIGDPRCNIVIDVRTNPRVSQQRADELAQAAAAKGYAIRRARRDEATLLAAVAREFGGAWPFELEQAFGHDPVGVHVAIAKPPPAHPGDPAATEEPAYCAFAAHDGNNRGLGWFGPTGTWPAHRGKGLGEALLMACLADVGREHARCEVAWIGPRPFYDKVAGIVDERRFVVLVKNLG